MTDTPVEPANKPAARKSGIVFHAQAAPPAIAPAAADPFGTAPVRSSRGLAIAAGAIGALAVVLGAFALLKGRSDQDITQLRPQFVRPKTIPYPPDNVPTAPRIDLGRQLFFDPRLSATGKVSCASCHKPEFAFTDGVAHGKGVSGRPLRMHTQTIWNVAWGRVFLWDGRAKTLEDQARMPMDHPDEMGQSIEMGALKLQADPAMRAAFAAAYPQAPGVTPQNIVKAIASFERTLVSPPTRFDRWVGGDDRALSQSERDGLRVFVGKGACLRCHSGWAFTDYAFHDVGMPADGHGRGRVLGLPVLDNAFKTPTLRELRWTAPYMHDGSMTTLDQVITHYEQGGVARASRSPDMPRRLDLTTDERRNLLAFLGTLSSDEPQQRMARLELTARRADPKPAAHGRMEIGQKDMQFAPSRVRIKAGESLVFMNNDSRPHNVRVDHPRMSYISEMQEPGDRTEVPFPTPGMFEVMCGVHPNMRLQVEVAAR